MTQAQITCFVEVAKHQSFSKAAAHMFISQPAVSKNVSLLESDLGLTMIDRSSANLNLTEAGKMFYELFSRFMNDFQSTWKSAKALNNVHLDSIRLGCLDGWDLSSFYPELCGFVVKNNPQLQIHLDGYNHVNILDALRSGAIDLALTLEIALSRQTDLSIRNVASAPTVVLISTLHPLAKKEELSLRDLCNEPFYVIAPSSEGDNPMERLTLEICAASGFTPKIEHVSNSASVLMRLQSGIGAQISCKWTGACNLPAYRVLFLDRQLNISAAWLKNDTNPAKQLFIQELSHHYHSHN